MTGVQTCALPISRPIVRENSYILYYQGLSQTKLGDKTKGTEIFNAMVSNGEKLITSSKEESTDFFAKFGEQEARNVQLSNAYLLKGLGYKGLGDSRSAVENLQKAVELSAGNLYARVELNEYK